MRFAGFTKGPVDEILTAEQLDQKRRHEWLRLKEELELAVVHANREALARLAIGRDTLLRVAVTAAELRAEHLCKAVALGSVRHPSPAQVEEVGAARRAFEEVSEAFEALERVIERGYVPLPKR
jgi:hypothetical protein